VIPSLENYIDGAWVAPADGRYVNDYAPGTGALIARIPRSSQADVDAAVAAAKRALGGPWGSFTVSERADLLDEVAEAIEDRMPELIELESIDTGKPVKTAGSIDIPRAVANFRFFAGAVRHAGSESYAMPGALNYTHRRAVGVCALITPWNLPLYLLSWKTAPALAMGNTIVAKPSEMTPLTANALAQILHDVGLPAGVFNLLQGDGEGAGGPLTAHPDVDAVSFTGGTATGKRVAAAAAPDFKKLSLELGGKNATIVFDDADLETAAAGAARAAFTNQGQVCLCGSRVLVQRALYEAFVERFVAHTRARVIGDPSDPATEHGALISQAHLKKVESYVRLARSEGATTLTGGRRPDQLPEHCRGWYLEPTILADLSPESRTSTEEIFGPVCTLHVFDTEAEAIAIANGVRYGLAASVWTRDLGRAHRVAQALETGMVWVNTWLLRDLRVPFGGMKDSGVGREGGALSLAFFSEARNICIKL